MTDPVDDALAAAREAMAITVPDGAADRAVAAALAAPAPPARTWWSAALPIAWRAAAVVDIAAIAAVVIAIVLRGSAPQPQPPRRDPVDSLLSDETSAVLERALRLSPHAEALP